MTLKKDKSPVSWFGVWTAIIAVACLAPLIPAVVEVFQNGYLGRHMPRAAAAAFESKYRDYFWPLALLFHAVVAVAFFASRKLRSLRRGVVFTMTVASAYLIFHAALSSLFVRLLLIPELTRFEMVIHGLPDQLNALLKARTESMVGPMTTQPLAVPQIMGLGFAGTMIYLTIQLFIVLGLAAAAWKAAGMIRRMLRKESESKKPDAIPLYNRRGAWRLVFCAIPGLIAISFTSPFSGANAPPPNIILISVDTLRADHLSCYGYKRFATPAMDRLASEGLLFEKAVSQSSWTLPSHVSMLTGLYPVEHGCNAVQGDNVIEKKPTPSPNTWRNYGYRTMAATGTLFVSPAYGLGQGFEHFHYAQNAAADKLTDAAIRYTQKYSNRPFFLFLHLFDPHDPYDPPDSFRSMYVSDEEAEKVDGHLDHLPAGGRSKGLDKERLDILSRLYDAEIRFTDAQLGRFFKSLSDLGLTDNTAIILTSDHGESFGENGEICHGGALYNQQIHVPLILRYPARINPGGREPRVVEASVRILPTIMDLVGLPIPESVKVPSLLAAAPDENGAAHSETLLMPVPQYSVQDERWKLIAKVDGKSEAADSELYDQISDWADSKNLAADKPAIVQRYYTGPLAEYLKTERRDLAPGPDVNLTPAQIEQLRSLGYIQ